MNQHPDARPRQDDRPWSARAVAAVALLPVHLWRSLAAFRSPRCRFHPSCSSYAVEAVQAHGVLRGSGLAIRRLGRCNPWNPGGVDHVPPAARYPGSRRPQAS